MHYLHCLRPRRFGTQIFRDLAADIRTEPWKSLEAERCYPRCLSERIATFAQQAHPQTVRTE